MNYRIFSTYYQLSLEGKVEALQCLVADHPILVPQPIEGGAVFECMLCSYKITPGSEMATRMMNQIARAEHL